MIGAFQERLKELKSACLRMIAPKLAGGYQEGILFWSTGSRVARETGEMAAVNA